jgi:hypothetical protein
LILCCLKAGAQQTKCIFVDLTLFCIIHAHSDIKVSQHLVLALLSLII